MRFKYGNQEVYTDLLENGKFVVIIMVDTFEEGLEIVKYWGKECEMKIVGDQWWITYREENWNCKFVGKVVGGCEII